MSDASQNQPAPGDSTPDSSSNAGANEPPRDEGEALVDRLHEALADARSKNDTYLDLAQRAQADFANYKRRVDRERAGEAQIIRGNTIAQILPLLDDLDRAVAHLPPDLVDHPWTKGVLLIGGRLKSTLERLGVEKIGTVGEAFDPNVHEAVAQESRPDVEPGAVSTVVRHGYRTADRLIRAAQVVVASPREDATAGADGQRSSGESTSGGAPDEAGRHVDERV